MLQTASSEHAFRWSAVDTTAATMHGYTKSTSGLDNAAALSFDGFSAYVSMPPPGSLPGAFHICANVALASYPWNVCPILDVLTLERDGGETGFSVGIDDRGRPRFALVTNTGLHMVNGETPLDLYQWHRLTFVFEPDAAMSIMLDGVEIGRGRVSGQYRPSEAAEALIGRTRHEIIPTGPIRPYAHLPITVYFDGLIETVTVANGLPGAHAATVAKKAEIAPRRLPAGPAGTGRFGATYEHLRYYDEWDRRWRIGDHPDVLVRFDKADYRVVFWRGTNYIPCWVSGDGVWYTNEFNETWGNGATGCAEPMSDKHCAYSHVRIIESHDARVVVHWRYALVDVLDVRPRKDPVSGWTDFSDEVYTIYPDGTAIRSITLHSTQPMEAHEFQESIVVLGPGQRPEDVLDIEPVTLANMKGETKTYSWADGRPRRLPEPAQANIAMINTKAAQRPFIIVPDGPCLTRDDGPQPAPLFPPYHHETLPEDQKFPWWNHWPTSDIPSDGRRAVAADRASHSSVLTGSEWADYDVTPTSRRRIMLHGLTTERAGDLVPLGAAWLSPPPIAGLTDGATSAFDPAEKAYVLSGTGEFSFTLDASAKSPVLNPAFILKDWTAPSADVLIDGRARAEGNGLRLGWRHSAERSDLIVWIELSAIAPVTIAFRPKR
ncbi:MAG TPA: LamG-like jellyroll fold domain-containing protein [Rhizobiaceae bacterium]|nr:LamG-like jellyroll fold domain-containing protein [Rhizobiaceae bacterium]